MATEDDGVRALTEKSDNEEDFHEKGEGQQRNLDPVLNIQSGKFGIKMNLRPPTDGASCSKWLREEYDDQQSLMKRTENNGDGKLISPVDELLPDEVKLSESIFMFPKKKMSNHGSVFEGEIRSGVCGIRPCVIKFAEVSEQNVREAKILSKLGSHTNVIAIVQSGTYSDILEDRFYIALDKCHEENLRQYLANRKNAGIEFDLEQANDFAHQIIDGVAYIHDNKVVHLDLKPSNILLSLNKRLIKIADFGLSRDLKSASSKFHFKVQFGTDGYRPVESFGDGWVSLRSDVFSLGAVFYHLLSNGEEIFGDDEHKYIYNVNNNVMDTSHLLVSNPKATEHLIKLMLSNERCRRPTILQVSEHPCWKGKDVECNFDYGYAEEIDDSDVPIPELKSQDSEDSDSEAERQLKFVQAFNRMEMARPPVRKPSIVIFDREAEHLPRFDPRNKTVTQIHEFNDVMKDYHFFRSFSIGDHIYVLMYDGSMYRFKYYDVAATWERVADLLEDHGTMPPALVASGSLIIAGGSFPAFTKLVTKYDPSLNRWKKLKDKKLKTINSANVASRGFVYCCGGKIGQMAIDRVERLNVVSQSWDEVASMRKARDQASAVECHGNVYVAGGQNRDLGTLNSVEKYDPDVNQWTIVKPMTKARLFFRCYLIDGSIYAVGPRYDGIEKYDVDKGEWEVVEFPKSKNMYIYESVLAKMKD